MRTWTLGDKATVRKIHHAWAGKSVTITSILPGSVVRVEDFVGDSIIININHLMRPQ